MGDGVLEGDEEKVRDWVQQEVEFYRVVEIARRKEWSMLPVRAGEGKDGEKVWVGSKTGVMIRSD
jgi:hypothetical protein